MTDTRPQSTLPELPPGAVRLGWAGVLPFLALSIAAWWPASREPAMQGFLAYGALILSFLGGARWGRAMAGGAGTGQFAAAVIPSLWGWLAWLLLPTVPALCLLAGGFALVAWWDGRGDAIPAPESFRRLRRGLSAAVLACHAIALAGVLVARG
jgi:hypothetical protein